MSKKYHVLWMIGFLLLLTGCDGSISLLARPTTTPVIIYITATPLPDTPTDLPETMTAEFDPTIVPSWTPLPTATDLPASPLPPSLTPTFTPVPTDTRTPKPATRAAQQTQTARAVSSGH